MLTVEGHSQACIAPWGRWLLVNEVNANRQLPIGSKPSQGSGGHVTANMSQPRENSRECTELCSSIHTYPLWEAEPNLYPSVSSAASHQNQGASWSVRQKSETNGNKKCCRLSEVASAGHFMTNLCEIYGKCHQGSFFFHFCSTMMEAAALHSKTGAIFLFNVTFKRMPLGQNGH